MRTDVFLTLFQALEKLTDMPEKYEINARYIKARAFMRKGIGSPEYNVDGKYWVLDRRLKPEARKYLRIVRNQCEGLYKSGDIFSYTILPNRITIKWYDEE